MKMSPEEGWPASGGCWFCLYYKYKEEWNGNFVVTAFTTYKFLRSQGCALDLSVHTFQRSSLVSKHNLQRAHGLFTEIWATYMLSTNGLLIPDQGWITLPFEVLTLKGQCFPTLCLVAQIKVMVIFPQNICVLMSVLNSVKYSSEFETDQ